MSGRTALRRGGRVGATVLAVAAGPVTLTPLAGHAAASHVARVCLDNGSPGGCRVVDPASSSGAGGGTEVASRPTAPLPPTGVYALPAADVDALRTWVADFADPAAAAAAGLTDLDLCFDMMGSHYADPATFADGVLDARKPEALVYADVDGTTKLVAVEWVSTSPGQVDGIPLHLNHDLDVWVLHAWVGLDNPSGMLADHNPNVGACQPDPGAQQQHAPTGGP
jgi:hypothetical protein